MYFSAITVTNISKNFTCKMAAKVNGHRYGTKLRHCHPLLSLPLLCRSLPILDQLCERSLNFVHRCVSHDSDVVKFISDYCIMYGRSNFCIGKNVMFCMRRYKCNVEMVFSGSCSRVTSASSALGILNDYALYTSAHSLTHSH